MKFAHMVFAFVGMISLSACPMYEIPFHNNVCDYVELDFGLHPNACLVGPTTTCTKGKHTIKYTFTRDEPGGAEAMVVLCVEDKCELAYRLTCDFAGCLAHED